MQTIVAKDGSTSRKWDGIVPAECAAEPGSILRLNKNLEWEEAHEPTHIDIDTSTMLIHPALTQFLTQMAIAIRRRLVLSTLICDA